MTLQPGLVLVRLASAVALFAIGRPRTDVVALIGKILVEARLRAHHDVAGGVARAVRTDVAGAGRVLMACVVLLPFGMKANS